MQNSRSLKEAFDFYPHHFVTHLSQNNNSFVVANFENKIKDILIVSYVKTVSPLFETHLVLGL